MNETDSTPPAPARRRSSRRGDTLGLAWVHGAFHAAAYRRQTRLAGWAAPEPVRTMEEFAAAMDAALAATGFGGTEAFFVLGHEEFVHQVESAPAFSESAARAYLRGRVERFEKDHEPVLWVSQRAGSLRKDAAYILHLLPRRFYDEINQVMRARRIDLTRVIPLLVPLQQEIAASGETIDRPLLYACEAGAATAVVVGLGNGEVWFTRTTLASWSNDAPRVAVEINRSLLYAKQQFSAVVDRLLLVGPSAEAARPEVEAKCGAGKHVVVSSGGPLHWLDSVARLPVRHRINLVAGYLQLKRRQRFLRRVIVAGCWLGLALLAFDSWRHEDDWAAEAARMASLRASEPGMRAERARLLDRNAAIERRQAFVHRVADDRLPPVADRFLPFVAGLLPKEARLAEFSIKWDEFENSWSFHAEGTIDADEETARTTVAGIKRRLAAGPVPVRLVENTRGLATVTAAGGAATQRFVLEGTIDDE
jgi:hypothetical protein